MLSKSTVKTSIDKISTRHATYSALFDADPTPILKGPCTEIARIVANDGVSRDDVLKPLLAQLVNIFRPISGVPGAIFGVDIEDDRALVLVAGWQSLEVRLNIMYSFLND